jgi:putative DNA methylase
LLSEYASLPLQDVYYQANSFDGIRIADPFMGGGIPLIEANRVGCDVIGYDINPMSYWIVKQEIEHLDLTAYRQAAENLRNLLEEEIGHLYRTKCLECGKDDAHVKYFLWHKTKTCMFCGERIDLLPGYLVSQNRRHPRNVFLCSECGSLTETEDRTNPGKCATCGKHLKVSGPAKRSRCICPQCGKENSYPDPQSGPPHHRLFAMEYYCPQCKPKHRGRFFKKPDSEDLLRLREVESRWCKASHKFIPDDSIPPGDESSRLHRWGYRKYSEMFNARQLLGLELSCGIIEKEPESRIRNALATNLSDLLRYQNLLCRYDKMALKSLDIFSVHGFPVGLIQCESNFLGIPGGKRGTSVGSGGWTNIIEKFVKAKAYCDAPFEVRFQGKRKHFVPIQGEWIGDVKGNGPQIKKRNIALFCSDARVKDLAPETLDGVFTDPPYFGNVQYAELMDFCYVWLRKLVGQDDPAFESASTRNANELTGNENMQRGIVDFTQGISSAYQMMAKALKPGSPLVFTYHHNDLSAYHAISVAILDAGLTCSASLPCPAEMGASIHINGTGSSIIDTVFVCRQTGKFPRRWLTEHPKDLALLISEELAKLRLGNVKLSRGDIRCIIFGHLARLAIWHLRTNWPKESTTIEKMSVVSAWMHDFGGLTAVLKFLDLDFSEIPNIRTTAIGESEGEYEKRDTEISF